MPALVEIPLHVIQSPALPITARQLHGALTAALAEHPERAVSAWPLLVLDGNDSELLLRLGWKPSVEVPNGLIEQGRIWRVGSLLATAGSPSVSYAHFEEMIATPAVEQVMLDVVSPALFRSTGFGGHKYRVPLPDPRRIYQRLVDDWNTYAVQHPIDPADAAHFLSALELLRWQPEMTTALLDRRPDGSEVTALGFLGALRIGLPGPRPPGAEKLLTALTQFLALTGVGSWTNRGLGATTISLVSATEQ